MTNPICVDCAAFVIVAKQRGRTVVGSQQGVGEPKSSKLLAYKPAWKSNARVREITIGGRKK